MTIIGRGGCMGIPTERGSASTPPSLPPDGGPAWADGRRIPDAALTDYCPNSALGFPPPLHSSSCLSAIRATVDTTGDVSYRANFADPLEAEIQLNVPKDTVGPTFDWHPDTEHLQVGLQGQHRSYRAAALVAAQNGVEADELFKIGAALSSPTVTLEDLSQMRKRLADSVILWETGSRSSKHGLGKNLLPSYELSNEHATLANTVKNIDGARYPGSNSELATLDKLLAEYAKIGEIVRQMYVVRMSFQAEATDNVLDCIIRARSIDQEYAEDLDRDLADAHTDVLFIKQQIMAMSALFKALYLALPNILAARVLPDATAKGIERKISTLVSVGEVQKIKQHAELRAGYTTASSASSSSTKTAKPKYSADERYAGKKKGKSPKPDRRGTPKTPVSTRPPATPASKGAEESAGLSRQQHKNAKQRKRRRESGDGATGSGSDDDRDADGGTPRSGGGRGGSGGGGNDKRVGSSDKRGGGKAAGNHGGGHDKKKNRSN